VGLGGGGGNKVGVARWKISVRINGQRVAYHGHLPVGVDEVGVGGAATLAFGSFVLELQESGAGDEAEAAQEVLLLAHSHEWGRTRGRSRGRGRGRGRRHPRLLLDLRLQAAGPLVRHFHDLVFAGGRLHRARASLPKAVS
jgi:hypothetical protein